MRTSSAAEMKGTSTCPRNKIPREGTQTRQIYDMFMANKGLVIEYAMHDTITVYRLVDFYGLDIRNMGYKRWVLAGEWFGKVYVDYIAERLTPAQQT